jgi:hypothetical protein
VSSTVYGIEELLDQVYALLGGFGYEVWMSHKGTVPILPHQTAMESCLLAVEKCDLFLSIITPRYGSGIVGGQQSITHQELLKAIELNKPRWILAHDHVVFARALLRKLGAKDQQAREKMLQVLGFDDEKKLKELRRQDELVLDDFRVIDMYEAAIRHDLKVYMDAIGKTVCAFLNSDGGVVIIGVGADGVPSGSVMNEQAASLTEFLRRTITPKVLYDVSFDQTAGGDVIAASFRDGQLSRESKPGYPFNSLREGLVNALVHRDYAAFSGGVSVSVYTDRVGRGTYKIGQECRDFGMRPPEWKNAGAGVRLTLFAAGVGIPAINLNNRQQELLATLVYGEAIRVPQYVERFGQGITDRQARRDLSDLENAGFLARHGAGSKTTYERTEKAL